MNALVRTLTALTLVLPMSAGHASILRVPADYPDIQSALDAAADGDDVVVAPDTYYETVSIPAVSVTLRSDTGDPTSTILDGSMNPGGVPLVSFEGNPTGRRVLRGFTLTHSADPAVDIDFTNESGHVVVEECRFIDNGPSTALQAGGTSVSILGNEFIDNRGYSFGGAATIHGSAQIIGNLFRNNDAIPFQDLTLTQGGAIYVVNLVGREGSVVEVIDNTFVGNHCTDYGGAIHLGVFQTTTVFGNVFENNVADICAGGVYVAAARDYPVTIENNLFVGNESPLGGGIGVETSRGVRVRSNTVVGSKLGEGIRVESSTEVVVEANVVAFGDQWGVRWPGSEAAVECNDVFGNTAGNMPGGVLGTNFSLDPRFCNLAAGNFTLAADSPCLPANNGCGTRVGAFGPGCTASPVEYTTWGRLKNAYAQRN